MSKQSAKDVFAEIERERLASQLRTAKQQQKAAIRHAAASEKRVDFLNQIAGTQQYDEWERQVKRHKTEATAIVALSDWHAEERVDGETIQDVNEYSPTIFQNRIKHVFQKIPVYLERHVPMATELYCALLGDEITGYIHEELLENNWMSPTEASLLVQRTIVEGFEFLLRETKVKKIIVPTCYGNHGRTTQKSRFATGYKNSFEWLMYNNLAQIMAKEKRIVWKIGKGYHNFVEIYGRQIRFHHGDSIRYSGGVGGISIPVNKAIAQWNKTKHADLDIFGHWHQYMDAWYWVSNGCLIGYNDYCVRIKAESQPPTQSFIVFDKRKGKRWSLPIYCD